MAVFLLVEEDRLEDGHQLRQPRCVGRRGDARLCRRRLGGQLFGRRPSADDRGGVCRAAALRRIRAAVRRGVVRGASRRSGSGRGLPAERLSGFAHMSRTRCADDSPRGCRRRSLSLPPDRESEPRPPLPGNRGLLRPGADRPDADVYPAARAGVVLQEAASRLPSAAAFASGTFGQRGGRQSDRHRLSPAGARAGGAQVARRRGAESGLHGHTPRPQRRVILAYR